MLKDVFPIGRIKFVKDVAPDVFSEQSLSGINDQHCFQVARSIMECCMNTLKKKKQGLKYYT